MYGVAVTVLVPHGCRHRHLCATCSVISAIGALCVVSQSQSLHRVGVTAINFVLRVVSCHCLCAICGVVVAVLVPCVCRGCHLCATCGVVGCNGSAPSSWFSTLSPPTFSFAPNVTPDNFKSPGLAPPPCPPSCPVTCMPHVTCPEDPEA